MSSNGRQGLGFLQVLTLIFIVLKLTQSIDWSWWWVLFPLWFPFIAAFLWFLPSAVREAKAEVEYEERLRARMTAKAKRLYEQRQLQGPTKTTPPTEYITKTNNGRASVFNSDNWE